MYIEPNAPALSSPSLIIEALLRDALTAREAADLLGDLRPIQRPRVALGDLAATIRAVRAALISSKQQAHAVVMMRRLDGAQSANAARMILADYAELGADQ